jgi:hypothetical protein
MIEKFPIREQDEERIKNDFRSIKVHCIRCGLADIEISERTYFRQKKKVESLKWERLDF